MVEADVVRRQELQLDVAETVVVTAGPVVVSFRIDPVGTIAPTTVVTSPEIVLTIGNVGGITSTTAFATPDTIQPMADVNLNANPFSSDGDIGSVTTELSSANVDTTLITALGGGIIITQ